MSLLYRDASGNETEVAGFNGTSADVKSAIEAIQAVIPSNASSSNQLVTASDNYSKVLYAGIYGATVFKIQMSSATMGSFSFIFGYCEKVDVIISTRTPYILAYQYTNGTSADSRFKYTVSSGAVALYVKISGDTPCSIIQNNKFVYNNASVTVSNVASSEWDAATALTPKVL